MWSSRRMGLLLVGMLWMPSSAEAKKKYEDGVPVTVVVEDAANEAIATAVVRHPDEKDRHRVNAETGEWFGSVLYMPDGSELVFTPGMSIQLEVSAPNYITKIIQYDIRKRNNKVRVELVEMEIDEEEIEDPVIQFGRDKPRDVGSTGPAN